MPLTHLLPVCSDVFFLLFFFSFGKYERPLKFSYTGLVLSHESRLITMVHPPPPPHLHGNVCELSFLFEDVGVMK